MGGQHIHYRVAQAQIAEANAAILERAAARRRAEARRKPCTCDHPADEHDGEDGCLYGWGIPPYDTTGCFCEGTPA